ncbi:MAG: helix-turn-helix domain-containing protein [Kiritimatiellaeota bacterium]|nr:helix-turn-helix domain-containing protein [Kiritimatiellota bacterium]
MKTNTPTAILPGYLHGRTAACQYLGGMSKRTLAVFMRQRKLPHMKLGHRTVLFRIADLDRALAKFRIEAVGGES